MILRPGTPVVIFGQYAYRERAPWKRLATDSMATHVTLAEVWEALELYLPPVRASGRGP